MSEVQAVPDRSSASTAELFRARLRGFGPIGLLAFVAISLGNSLFQPLTALGVLAWAWLSRTPWRELGFRWPEHRWRAALLGIGSGVVFKLAMKALVMPLLGADPINRAYHFLAGNTAQALLAIPMMIVFAGFGEETYFRGYLFERGRKLLGNGVAATVAVVLATALFFGVLHYPDQGRDGALQATIVGLAFGAIYARTRSLWPLMCAHAAFDLTALALIYWELETRVAHWVF